MEDKDKTKEELLSELLQARQRVAELEGLAEEWEQAREELRGERDRSQKYFDVAYGIMVIIDSHGKARLINQKGCEVLGYKKKEILGKSWYDNFVPERIRDEVKAVSAQLMAGKIKPVEYFENPVVTRNGEERLIAWHNAVLKDEEGNIIATLSSGEDITERRKAEEELRESNARYQLLMDKSLESMWFTEYEEPIDITLPEMEIARLINERGVITQANNALAKAYGFNRRSQLAGKHWAEFMPFEENKEFYLKFVRSNYNIRDQVSIDRDRKGNILYAEDSSVGNIVDGKLVNTFGVGRDITERRKAEKELRKSNERYQLLMDSSVDGIWFSIFEEPIDITLPEAEIVRLMDEREIIVEANDAVAKLFGFEEVSQLIGKRWSELGAPGVNSMNSLELVRSHYKIDRRVLTQKDLRGNITYYEDSEVCNIVDNKLVSSFGLTKDITERYRMEAEKKELERRAQLASRLATVGEMASGIAHEINNPLTGVIGFAQLLAQKKDIPEDIREYTKIIHDGAQRVAGIVDRLLTFARQHKPEKSYTSINDIIEATLKLRAYEMESSNIKLSTRLDPDLPGTVADAAQLQQVFLNIIINAEAEMKSAHGKGELQVKTEGTDNTIRISFTDDGPGIAPENLERICDPFFTTREVGKGTGLGLSLCHGVIAEHHGRLYARSKLGQGATFVIELPVVAEEKQLELAEPAVGEAEKVTGARILVVDDEPTILQFLSQILTDEGHRVETVESADAALEKIKSERYNLILLDIKLPGMSGMELYRKIKRIAQTLARRVVFITGDVMATDTRNFLSRAKAPYISKPFDAEKLIKDINRILAEGT